jgi:hypothetical protein
VGSVVQIEAKSKRHAAEDAVWHAERSVAALQVLANDGAYFFDTEIMGMRRTAHELIAIADQIMANRKVGLK